MQLCLDFIGSSNFEGVEMTMSGFNYFISLLQFSRNKVTQLSMLNMVCLVGLPNRP